MVVASKLDNVPKRIVALVDTYTFATQVLAKAEGNTQWNSGPSVAALNSGRIISANLYAKTLGINNSIKLNQAKAIYPDLTIFYQPNYEWGKPDQTIFRAAGYQIFRSIQKFTGQFQCPPILHWVPQDETYIDLTDEVDYYYKNNIKVKDMDPDKINIFPCLNIEIIELDDSQQPEAPKWPLTKSEDPAEILKFRGRTEHEKKLMIASKIISQLQEYIQKTTLFHCSAGVGSNKMLAKIACSLNSPGSLSFLSKTGICKKQNSEKVPLKKLSPLKSHVKRTLEANGITTMWQLQTTHIRDLAYILRSMKEALYVQRVARGDDMTPVVERICSNTVNCARNFFRKFHGYPRFLIEVNNLVKEMQVRLQEQFNWFQRCPTKIQLVVNFVRGVQTRTIQLNLHNWQNPNYLADVLENARLPVHCGVIRLKLSALKFENIRGPSPNFYY